MHALKMRALDRRPSSLRPLDSFEDHVCPSVLTRTKITGFARCVNSSAGVGALPRSFDVAGVVQHLNLAEELLAFGLRLETKALKLASL